MKVSDQNQCEIDEAPNSGHTRGGKSCSTTPSLHCDSMDLFEMNAQVSSGNVLRFTAARKIPMMRTQQPAAFGLESVGGTTRTDEGTRPAKATSTLKSRKTRPDGKASRDKDMIESALSLMWRSGSSSKECYKDREVTGDHETLLRTLQ